MWILHVRSYRLVSIFRSRRLWPVSIIYAYKYVIGEKGIEKWLNIVVDAPESVAFENC